MAYQRIDRISEEVRKEISNIIRDDIKDPRVSSLVSIVKVDVTKDLRHAKVYTSVLGTEQEKMDAIEGLKRASGYIRKEIGSRLEIRYTPELHFVLDSSIEYSIQIAKKLNEIKNDQGENNG